MLGMAHGLLLFAFKNNRCQDLFKEFSYYSFSTRMRRYFHIPEMALGLMMHNTSEFVLLSNFDFSLLMSAVSSLILKLYFFNIMFKFLFHPKMRMVYKRHQDTSIIQDISNHKRIIILLDSLICLKNMKTTVHIQILFSFCWVKSIQIFVKGK